MRKCQGIIPETTRPLAWRVITDDDGERVLDEDGQIIRDFTIEVVPAHPCPAEATMLARSMREVVTATAVRDDGSTVQMLAWVPIEDREFCGHCFVPGTMTHLDGTVTQHPAMAL